MATSFAAFFNQVTKRFALPYQERYGTDPFAPTVMVIPTGLGKTDTVILPWLFAQSGGQKDTPTRLVIVQPGQNLTEQTAARARALTESAGLSERVRVLELMAGSDDNADTLGPDEPAILVCTQDMYFSRALNRGYARRPPRWPIDFALLNNDCQIVFDEIQLMGDALATSTQLAAMRDLYGVFGRVPCVWMSATLNTAWLDTVDFRGKSADLRKIMLEPDDLQTEIAQKRYHASRRVEQAPESCRDPGGCAEFALSQHREGERTLIITNTVGRAREICQHLKGKSAHVLLLHSRFRPAERRELVSRLNSPPPEGQIVVATQVLEAGADITSHRLITDSAPWGSLVQRFGRVNRYGEIRDGATIWWVDQPLRSKAKPEDMFAPYESRHVEVAQAKLSRLKSASPANLPEEDGPAPWRHVLRRSDLLDLFDTSPDLSGNEIDISRFIRSGEERDVYIAWRAWEGDLPDEPRTELRDEELCAAPIGEVREFAKRAPLYRWDFVGDRWERADREKLFPGMMLMTSVASGGYTADSGWSPESKEAVPEVKAETGRSPDGDTSDFLSVSRVRQTLRDHTDAVVAEMRSLIAKLEGTGVETFRAELERSAALHDWGKTHRVMQETLRAGERTDELLAKSAANRRHRIRHFRHELASALAMTANGEPDLAAYVVAAHHGKVRMSIRTMPGEQEQRTRGIKAGDVLPEAEIGNGVRVPAVSLSLDLMKMGTEDGAPSWTDRILRLRQLHGPFRLACLEMLLRIADERASAKAPVESGSPA